MKDLNRFQKRSLENSENYFKGKMVIKNNLKPIDIKEGIDWGYEENENKKTYQIYLHSLNIIKDLTIAGYYTKNNMYFKEAKKIILNWYKSKSNDNEKWNEHAVSTRIKNIIYFQESEHSYKINKRKYLNIIEEHCEFLNNEENYKKNNHGLMMDIALIFSCSVLSDEKQKQTYLEKALYRVRFAFYRDFSWKGVHLENSPEYHKLLLRLFEKLKEALNRHDLKVDRDIDLIVKNAKVYSRHIIKPDSTYPLIGDTGHTVDKRTEKSYKNFIDYEAGIAIIHNKNQENNSKSAYLTFKSGYQSKTHKHYDDLSITYYNDGHDILIDSGKFSYDKFDPIRDYIISANAHNTIVIKDKKYTLKEPFIDQKKLKLSELNIEKYYKKIVGMNGLYTGITMDRHVILTEDDILFLVDSVSSLDYETIQILFNFKKEANVERITELKYRITINNINYILESYPIRNKNIKSNLDQGYYSEVFSKIDTNKKVIFEVESKRMIFFTSLYKEEAVTIKQVVFRNSQLSFYSNDSLIKIKI